MKNTLFNSFMSTPNLGVSQFKADFLAMPIFLSYNVIFAPANFGQCGHFFCTHQIEITKKTHLHCTPKGHGATCQTHQLSAQVGQYS